ncbi:MAG: SGNH/GDSL hydrolase family protein [Chlorobiaceae bacterium]|nr:SGNH/GDSL hydrolase family protein [Chlorobiaceae bacterium]
MDTDFDDKINSNYLPLTRHYPLDQKLKSWQIMNTQLLRASLFILIGISGLLVLFFSYTYIAKDTSLDSFITLPDRTTPSQVTDQINIGIIGDSWVSGKKIDQPLEQAMSASGFETKIISSGQPGATSRDIYRNLFLDKSARYSSNALLMDEDIDYLVIVAGVNDSVQHYGASFYAHHTLLVAQTALARGIIPVIVEVPEYGIEKFSPSGLISWYMNTLYLWIFDHGNKKVMKSYRSELRKSIPQNITDKVIMVDFSMITEDYETSKYLYDDPAHLNREGNVRLGKLIGNSIIEWQKKSRH